MVSSLDRWCLLYGRGSFYDLAPGADSRGAPRPGRLEWKGDPSTRARGPPLSRTPEVAMALTDAQIEQQRKQAEELLFSGPQTLGFAKGLFFGHFNAGLLFPYPEVAPEERPALERSLAEVKRFCAEHIDAAAIDRNAEIPQSVVDGLGQLGVLGMTAPKEVGGRGFSQLAYTQIMEVIGGHCSSTAVFVNAPHSIGLRAL